MCGRRLKRIYSIFGKLDSCMTRNNSGPAPTIKLVSVCALFCLGLFVAVVGCGKGPDEHKPNAEFEIDKVYERGPLTVHIRTDREKMTIAETLLLELQAAIKPEYELRMPKVDKLLEHFGIVDWDDLGDKLDEDGSVVRTHRYRLEPFLSGEYQLPILTFEFYDANSTGDEEKKHELSTEPIDVEVTSLLGEQREQLVIADIEDVVEMPRTTTARWVWPTAAALVACAAMLVFVYLRRKTTAELVRIFKPAHEVAYALLRALVKDDLIKAGKIKEFHERISDILRHYIEHRFALRAPERTTEEFLAELQHTDVLTETDKESIGEFLKHCDLVKFAKHEPATEQIQQTFDLVKAFIEKTRSDEQKVDVTDRTETEQAVEAGSA